MALVDLQAMPDPSSRVSYQLVLWQLFQTAPNLSQNIKDYGFAILFPWLLAEWKQRQQPACRATISSIEGWGWSDTKHVNLTDIRINDEA